MSEVITQDINSPSGQYLRKKGKMLSKIINIAPKFLYRSFDTGLTKKELYLYK